ncbi:MAG: hypothetical protein DMF06_11235 [Verrucomicrobia bacterium]|nr:MAG: hypothetical protein DMF06_11235 [Verrucomicrobiota bacterium]
MYHGARSVATLKELVRCYSNLVDDSTRVMQRVKALYRGRAIGTKGEAVYRPSQRKIWLGKLDGPGAKMRAASLLAQLDTLLELRRKARVAMIAEARRQSGWRSYSQCHSSVRSAWLTANGATNTKSRQTRKTQYGNTQRQNWSYMSEFDGTWYW